MGLKIVVPGLGKRPGLGPRLVPVPVLVQQQDLVPVQVSASFTIKAGSSNRQRRINTTNL